MKKFITRSSMSEEEVSTVAVLEPSDDNGLMNVSVLETNQKEFWRDVKIGENFSKQQKEEVRDIISKFGSVFSNVPGKTHLMKHKMRLCQQEIVRTKPYQIPFALRESVNQNIEEMLRLDIIEPSESPICNPMVVVKKPDNNNCICLDFRNLNNITIFDREPMSDTEEIFSCLAKSTYFYKGRLNQRLLPNTS